VNISCDTIRRHTSVNVKTPWKRLINHPEDKHRRVTPLPMRRRRRRRRRRRHKI